MKNVCSNVDKKFVCGNSYDIGDFDSCISTRVNDMAKVGKHYNKL